MRRLYEHTCGSFVLNNKNEVLLCHPTGHPHWEWTVPKGMPNMGEGFYEAAVRELKEEAGFNIELFSNRHYELGSEPYTYKKKIIWGFAFILDGNITTATMSCDSFFYHERYQVCFPEVDYHRWVKLEMALSMVPEQQYKLLLRLREHENHRQKT
jgi:predicted NUDIX family NTP pyrophosphohydrolase